MCVCVYVDSIKSNWVVKNNHLWQWLVLHKNYTTFKDLIEDCVCYSDQSCYLLLFFFRMVISLEYNRNDSIQNSQTSSSL